MLDNSTLFENLVDQASKLFLSKEQLARVLNVSPKTIEAWRFHYKDFPARKLGRHVRYSLNEVLFWHELKNGGQRHGK